MGIKPITTPSDPLLQAIPELGVESRAPGETRNLVPPGRQSDGGLGPAPIVIEEVGSDLLEPSVEVGLEVRLDLVGLVRREEPHVPTFRLGRELDELVLETSQPHRDHGEGDESPPHHGDEQCGRDGRAQDVPRVGHDVLHS